MYKNEMNLEIFQAFKTSLYKYIYIYRERERARTMDTPE